MDKEKYIGLTQEEADRLLKARTDTQVGKKKISAARIFAGQFHDVMSLILLAAAAISVAIGGWQEAVPIMLIVVMNAALGFIQEYRCEKTLEQMEKLTAPTARVYRDGTLCTIAADNVVCGDVLEISAGERFPCDCVILSATALSCDESALTGENMPVHKTSFRGQKDTASPNLEYMGYMGTVVLRGSARCEAVAVGSAAQMGKISQMIADIEEQQTPLQKKLAELGRILALICLGVCLLVFVVGILRGEAPLNMFFTAVTVAIAAIPEGLPAAVTIALALAVRRMLRQNALVHKLHSVETLGCANVIFTDKTGTLTKNQMTVTAVSLAQPEGMRELHFKSGEKGLADKEGGRYMAWEDKALSKLLLCAALCNNAKPSADKPSKARNRAACRKKFSGDPTEAALLELCDSCGIEVGNLLPKRLDEKPFDSESKYMSVTCCDREGRRFVFTKGAPDILLGLCTHIYSGSEVKPLTQSERAAVIAANDSYAAKGLRVIAFCESSVFLGLAAISDPLREQAAAAVVECRRAGISTVMITGDHKLTACAIAREAGILTAAKRVCTGAELDKMSDSELAEELENIAVFARVTPAHKLRIVRACKQKGKVCAMTGDGVNDAPAIKEASIGVSMGISGTDVTKQAADMILLDDNFATLVTAVREGRTIYSNIRKFVRYLIACNIGEVLVMLGGMLMGMPIALLPSQLLLVNLVTDGLPAAALSVEPPEKGVMCKPPRSEEDSFFSGGLMTKIITRGILIAICTLGCFSLLLGYGLTLAQARTGALLTLIFSQLIHVFECRSEDKPLFKTGLRGAKFAVLAVISSAFIIFICMAVPTLSQVFSLVSPGALGLATAAAASVAVPLTAAIKQMMFDR